MDIGIRQPPAAGQMGMPAFAEWAASVGFAAIDVPALTPELKSLFDSHGLRCGTFDFSDWGALLSPDAAERAAALPKQKDFLKAQADLGCTVAFAVLLPRNPQQSRQQSFEIFRESFPPVIEFMAGLGLQFAIEAWPGPGPWLPSLGCTPETLRAIFGAIDAPNLGLCYDPSHLIRLGIDHMRFLHEFGSRVKHVHGKDTELIADNLYLTGNIGPSFGTPASYVCGERHWRYTIPGEGTANWKTIGYRLKEVGYTGLVCVELEDHHYWHTVENQQRGMVNALKHLKKTVA